MAKRHDDDYEEDDDRRARKRRYPTVVRIAAIAWIVFGCLVLLTGLLNLVVQLVAPEHDLFSHGDIPATCK